MPGGKILGRSAQPALGDPPWLALPLEIDEEADLFAEVSAEFIQKQAWRVATAQRWRRQRGPIHVLEGVALAWCVRRLGRNTRQHHLRHLILSDNLSLVCALMKGRAQDWKLLSICRQVAAVSLSCDLRLSVRWVASELNPADEPSRRFEPRSKPPGHDRGARVAGDATAEIAVAAGSIKP